MPTYQRLQSGFTVAQGATALVFVSWQNIRGVGPNHGPVIFAADPRSHASAEVVLVTSDVAKCRNAPSGPPPQNPGTEVFYRFSVRNESSIDATYDIELVFGQISSPNGPW
jgi:hypothetical protein